MNLNNLCPLCLAELPDGYPFDHVAIDLALSTQPDLFDGMTRAEQAETVLAGLDRAQTISCIAVKLHTKVSRLRALLPDDHPESTARHRALAAAERTALIASVKRLWHQGLPDTDISLRTGHTVYQIAGIRRQLGLATLPPTRRWNPLEVTR